MVTSARLRTILAQLERATWELTQVAALLRETIADQVAPRAGQGWLLCQAGQTPRRLQVLTLEERGDDAGWDLVVVDSRVMVRGHEVPLGGQACLLLHVLAQHGPLDRRALEELVWQGRVTSRTTVAAAVSRINGQLRAAGLPRVITSSGGAGRGVLYRLRDDLRWMVARPVEL